MMQPNSYRILRKFFVSTSVFLLLILSFYVLFYMVPNVLNQEDEIEDRISVASNKITILPFSKYRLNHSLSKDATQEERRLFSFNIDKFYTDFYERYRTSRTELNCYSVSMDISAEGNENLFCYIGENTELRNTLNEKNHPEKYTVYTRFCNGAFLKLMNIELSEGTMFSEDDYTLQDKNGDGYYDVNVIVGENYRGGLSVGDQFEGLFLTDKVICTVIGFAAPGQLVQGSVDKISGLITVSDGNETDNLILFPAPTNFPLSDVEEYASNPYKILWSTILRAYSHTGASLYVDKDELSSVLEDIYQYVYVEKGYSREDVLIEYYDVGRTTESYLEEMNSALRIILLATIFLIFFGLTVSVLDIIDSRKREYAVRCLCGARHWQIALRSFSECTVTSLIPAVPAFLYYWLFITPAIKYQ